MWEVLKVVDGIPHGMDKIIGHGIQFTLCLDVIVVTLKCENGL